MQAMQETGVLTWIEVQFLKTASTVLLDARQTLMWTYAFAYYLAKDNATFLFEDNQRVSLNLNIHYNFID